MELSTTNSKPYVPGFMSKFNVRKHDAVPAGMFSSRESNVTAGGAEVVVVGGGGGGQMSLELQMMRLMR